MTGVLSHSHNLIILILASVLLLYGLAPASAVTSYKPGVKPGNSATYGQVKADWKSDLAPFSPVKDFLGASSTQPEPGGFCKFLRVWDQNTGILLGFVLNYTVSNGNYHVSASASMWMTATNLWVLPQRTAALLPPPIFGLAAFFAVIGSASAYALHGKRRLI